MHFFSPGLFDDLMKSKSLACFVSDFSQCLASRWAEVVWCRPPRSGSWPG